MDRLPKYEYLRGFRIISVVFAVVSLPLVIVAVIHPGLSIRSVLLGHESGWQVSALAVRILALLAFCLWAALLVQLYRGRIWAACVLALILTFSIADMLVDRIVRGEAPPNVNFVVQLVLLLLLVTGMVSGVYERKAAQHVGKQRQGSRGSERH